jgi:hypothetical protein
MEMVERDLPGQRQLTKTTMVDEAKSHTQAAQLTTPVVGRRAAV